MGVNGSPKEHGRNICVHRALRVSSVLHALCLGCAGSVSALCVGLLAKRSKKAAKRARQKEKRERQQAEKRARGVASAAAGGAAAGEEGAGGGVKHQHQPPRAAVDPAQPNT